MNIAVCDDEENIRIYIKKLIEEQDVPCQVMEFSSGEELLRFWGGGQEDREQLDILFLDISMDGTDGMETAEQIRDWKEEREEVLWGSLPLLIFVTGYPEYMPKAFSVNAFQYLVKPVDETVKHSSLPEILMEHGVGLKNVRDVAERYLGYMDIKAGKDVFKVTVMLQQKEIY